MRGACLYHAEAGGEGVIDSPIHDDGTYLKSDIIRIIEQVLGQVRRLVRDI